LFQNPIYRPIAALQTSLKGLIPPGAGLRFFIGLRLALERNLAF
jgi:hypothetical protein